MPTHCICEDITLTPFFLTAYTRQYMPNINIHLDFSQTLNLKRHIFKSWGSQTSAFGQSQASCFPLIPVFMLRSHLPYRYESGINPLI